MNLLTEIFLEVARKVDGAALIGPVAPGPMHVLAVGKVSFPMFEGLIARVGADAVTEALLIAPRSRFPEEPRLPKSARALVSDHPEPSERSVAAGVAARAFVERLGPGQRLLVLLSGGGSSLMTAPADGLTLADKRVTVKAVARAGATIAELNAVRKHLSAVKGGRLALATRAPTQVLALSDVVGNEPGTIASGPFSPDPTTFAEALALVDRLAPDAPARAHLQRGAAGAIPETPKPGDARLAHVEYEIIAGPERVTEEARHRVLAAGLTAGVLSMNTEEDVPSLAAAYVERALHEADGGGPDRVLVGNGEPSIVVTGDGRGGRATHLALLVARGIAGRTGLSFLAAGTDDRDGNSGASGAVVDGTTWQRAVDAGLDPAGALERCDSARPLDALGCLVRGPGTSNLLDLHLLAVTRAG